MLVYRVTLLCVCLALAKGGQRDPHTELEMDPKSRPDSDGRRSQGWTREPKCRPDSENCRPEEFTEEAKGRPNSDTCRPEDCTKILLETQKMLVSLMRNFSSSLQIHERRTDEIISNLKEKVAELQGEIKTLSTPGSFNNPADSCKDIFEQNRTAVSGPYYLRTATPVKKSIVYCHMDMIEACGDAGWTLLMKTDGTKRTFHYSSSYWSNKLSYNPGAAKYGLDKQEIKLASYWSTPFEKLCLGMETEGDLRWSLLWYSGDSLYDVIADGKYKATPLGLAGWRNLISRSSFQANCNREGFNVDTSMKVRLGIVGNNENDCDSNDSRIGFGGGGGPGCSNADDSNTCGNNAGCGADWGDRNVKAFGYILAI